MNSISNQRRMYKDNINLNNNVVKLENVLKLYAVGCIENEYNRELFDKSYENFVNERLSTYSLSKYTWVFKDLGYPFKDINNVIVTSEYGWRKLKGKLEAHRGIDLVSLYDAKIYSVASGTVIFSGYNKTYGNFIRIKHYVNDTYYITTYAHLEERYVKKDDIINKDQLIGIMGSSGHTTGTHLYFSIAKYQRGGYYSSNPFGEALYGKYFDSSKHKNLY